MVSKSNKRVGIFLVSILVVIGLVLLFVNMKNNNVKNDGNYTPEEQSMAKETLESSPSPDTNSMMLNAAPADVSDNNSTPGSQNANPAMTNARNQGCFPKDQLTAQELLPQNDSSTWAQVNPSGSGNLKDKNFLQAGHHIGINTTGQTLRNANLQLRSEPPCPQVIVSPWMQTTINPDMNRKPFEIGGCA